MNRKVVYVVTCVIISVLLFSTFNIKHRVKNARNPKLDTHVVNHPSLTEAVLDNNSSKPHVTILVHNVGLGNQLFAFASLLGIARKNNMPVIFPPKLIPFKKYFVLERTRYLPFRYVFPNDVYQLHRGRKLYDQRTDSVSKLGKDVQLRGYFHSWKYFSETQNLLRAELSFKQAIQEKVASFFTENIAYDWCRTRCIKVGIHIRRGDFLRPSAQKHGYTVATAGYIHRSISYFVRQFSQHPLIFVVASDDIEWCKQALNGSAHNVVFASSTKNRVLDLAILSACDHMITSTGTFSWWAGFLANGSTTYFQNFPLPGSHLARDFAAEDYYLPHWIPIN